MDEEFKVLTNASLVMNVNILKKFSYIIFFEEYHIVDDLMMLDLTLNK
jgi:hypothetical protein